MISNYHRKGGNTGNAPLQTEKTAIEGPLQNQYNTIRAYYGITQEVDSMILNIKKMTEEDIKLNSLTRTTNASGRQNSVNIAMETKSTDSEVNIRENKGYCERVKRADYLIYLNKYHPIVIVVAKDNNKTISYGM